MLDRRILLAAGGAVLAVTLTAACAAHGPVAGQTMDGLNNNLMVSDSPAAECGAVEHGAPVDFTAPLLDDSALGANDFPGQVTVLNF